MCICQEIKSCKKGFYLGRETRLEPETHFLKPILGLLIKTEYGVHLETQGLASPGPWTTAGLKCSESSTGELQDMDLQFPKCLISSVRLYDPLWNLPY